MFLMFDTRRVMMCIFVSPSVGEPLVPGDGGTHYPHQPVSQSGEMICYSVEGGGWIKVNFKFQTKHY